MTSPPDLLCSQSARAAGDDPAGTAAEFSAFLLLDHRMPWSATAAEDAAATLPAETSAAATAAAMKFFAIRSVHPRRAGVSPAAYLGINGPDGYLVPLPELPTPTELRRPAAPPEPPEPPASPEPAGPLFAVCTNGRRDRCCAIVGRGVAAGLHERFGDQVVEISHLGGHRYAGTMLVLPWGYAYGFLDLAAATEVAQAAQDGLVHPAGLRGRADLSPVAQAADVLVRREIGPAPADAVVIGEVQPGIDRSVVSVLVHGDARHLELRRTAGPTVRETLCGGKPFDTGQWTLVNG